MTRTALCSVLFGVWVVGCNVSDSSPPQNESNLTEGEMFTEDIRPGEEEEFAKFAAMIQEIQDAHKDDNGGEIKRGFHAKIHGCFQGELTVSSDIPEEAKHGLFSTPATYPAWVRFSNGQGKPKPDKARDVRGLAIKLVGVPGKKLLEHEEDAVTQDFLMTNRPASHVDDAAQFMEFAEATKSDLDFAGYLLLHPKVAFRLAQIRSDVASLLDEPYWSGSAYKLGPRAAKFAAKPCAASGKSMPKDPSDDYLREDLRSSLAAGDGCFDFMVQLQKDPKDFPIEKASVEWDEEESPFVKVAELRIPRQDLDAPENAEAAAAKEAYCDKLSFTPWHALPDHRPLGHINRARKAVYEASRDYRTAEGFVPEPDGTETF